MRARRNGLGGAARYKGFGAALLGLGVLCLTATGASALSFTFKLDAGVFPSPGSRVVPVNQVTPTPYVTGTEFMMTVASLSDGAVVTLHDFALPQPINGLDIDFVMTNLTLGLADLDPGNGIFPDTSATVDLLGTLDEVSPGFFDVTFAPFTIYWSGTRPGLQPASGSFPFVISTVPTLISTSSTTSGLFVVQNGSVVDPGDLPANCDGGAAPPGFGFPVSPLTGGTDFGPPVRFTVGGATCPSGLSFISGLSEERPFSIELTGILVPEPGTLLMMAGGLLGLAAAGRSRRAA